MDDTVNVFIIIGVNRIILSNVVVIIIIMLIFSSLYFLSYLRISRQLKIFSDDHVCAVK